MKRAWPILLLSLSLLCLASAMIILKFSYRQTNDVLTLYGNVDVRQVDISFRVEGQLNSLSFEEGDFIPKGALIAQLDSAPYDQQVIQAKGNLAIASANAENAKILMERREVLIGSGGVSQEDLDNAKAAFKESLGQLQSAKAALAIAEDQLSYTQVFAPNDGILLTRIREPGSVLNISEPLCTLSLSSPIWIRAFVGEKDLGRVVYGMDADIYTDNKGAPIYKGKVGFISPVAEFTPKTVQTPELRTDLVYRLRIYVEHPDALLKQGMPVTIKLYE